MPGQVKTSGQSTGASIRAEARGGSLKVYFTENPEKAIEADSFAEATLVGGLATSVTGPSGQRVDADTCLKRIGGGA